MYGWRGRIGVIIPSVNTTFEPECYRIVPEGVSFHFSRMPIGDLSVEGLQEMGRYVKEKGKELAGTGADIIVYGCTSGSFFEGKEHDQKIMRELEAETKIPALTTSTAVLRALKALAIDSVAICTPYSDEINTRQKEFFEAQGVRVEAIQGLGFVKKTPAFPLSPRPVSHIGLQEPSVAYKLAKIVNVSEAKGLLISCTNLRTLEIIEQLERDLRKPVVTSIQATVWAAFRQLSIYDVIQGAGTLFNID